PARARRAPKYPPTPPAPSIAILILRSGDWFRTKARCSELGADVRGAEAIDVRDLFFRRHGASVGNQQCAHPRCPPAIPVSHGWRTSQSFSLQRSATSTLIPPGPMFLRGSLAHSISRLV